MDSIFVEDISSDFKDVIIIILIALYILTFGRMTVPLKHKYVVCSFSETSRINILV